jgi:DNA polymerase III subunit epsilon
MMLLFYDTETTGLLNFKESYQHETQPSLVQLAAVLTDNDGTERACLSMIVDPGRPIPKQASDVHGITDDIVERCSVPPAVALNAFKWLVLRADTMIGHNQGFDQKVMSTAFHRSEMDDVVSRIDNVMVKVDTMKPATKVVKILHKKPRHERDYKWPKLEECIRFFFDEELEGAHDALVDVRACMRVYHKLLEGGIYK